MLIDSSKNPIGNGDLSMHAASHELLLATQAFQAFRHLLATGQVRAGQLVSIAELMRLMDFPLAPVREAVKRAAAAGLVSVLPKRGVLVLEATAQALHDCFHLRCLFDQEGARLLAHALPAQKLALLKQQHQEVLEQARKGHATVALQIRAMEVDWSLHRTLAQALGNPSALAIYEENCDRINVMQHSRRPLPERIVPAMEEHLLILDRLENKDAEAAMQAVRDHLKQTLRWWGILEA